ncbi:endonuclease NucS [Variovorax sp. S2]|uniref:endonuclease NucS domain-containing protein n=1 Tax=Variovorax sp. S12S4 TaxID=3029170 RepID=UPI00215BFCBD|nr:endonuclease NucS domain-containing protein [Variovorax sp. S12S4]MCR8957344.1 endonuclease NucS [Variovorax sp. S12S4]
MPIHHAIWRIGDQPAPLFPGRLASEQQLEDMIVRDPRILSSEWMLIGRQEVTSHGGRIDLLAIAPDASLVLIELKRDRTPREIIAQALDYASWVEQLTPDRVAQIFQRFSGGKSLDAAFQQRFGLELDEETLNQSHQIIIVAAELDPSTERIIGYLNARDIAINVVFFQVFEHGIDKLLSRAWLIDPVETQANVASTSTAKVEKEPWNGEFYVSFGDESSRSWDDARRFGFISGGGGSWYSQTLKLLSPGDRVWVKIPKKGYVGVGTVLESVQSVNDFKVQTESGEQPALIVLKHADLYLLTANDPERAEHFVRVQWLDTVSEDKAINEVGLFGNQNTVCKPTTPKWRHTVDRLKGVFPRWAEHPGV